MFGSTKILFALNQETLLYHSEINKEMCNANFFPFQCTVNGEILLTKISRHTLLALSFSTSQTQNKFYLNNDKATYEV